MYIVHRSGACCHNSQVMKGSARGERKKFFGASFYTRNVHFLSGHSAYKNVYFALWLNAPSVKTISSCSIVWKMCWERTKIIK